MGSGKAAALRGGSDAMERQSIDFDYILRDMGDADGVTPSAPRSSTLDTGVTAGAPGSRSSIDLDYILRDFDRAEPEEDMGVLEKGVSHGGNVVAMLWHGAGTAVDDLMGWEEWQAAGRDLVAKYRERAGANAEGIPNFSDIETGEDFWRWALFNVASGAVTSAPALAAGTLSAVSGPAGWVAGFGALYAMGTGDIYASQLEDRDDPNVWYALAGAVPYAAAEKAFGAGSILARRLTKTQQRAYAKNFLKRLAGEVPKAMASEAVAESIQTVISEGARRLEGGESVAAILNDPDLWYAVKEAAAAGAIGGAPFGAAAAIPRRPDAGAAEQPEQPGQPGQSDPAGAPDAQPTPETPQATPVEPAEADRLTPDDRASPIPSTDIERGKEIIDQAVRASEANKALRETGLPTIGQRVTVQRDDLNDGQPFDADVFDAYDMEGVQGVQARDDAGVEHYLDADSGVTFQPVPTAQERAQAADDQRSTAAFDAARASAERTGLPQIVDEELAREGYKSFDEVPAERRQKLTQAIQKRAQAVEKQQQVEQKQAEQVAKDAEKAEKDAESDAERIAQDREKEQERAAQKAERERVEAQKEADAQAVYQTEIDEVQEAAGNEATFVQADKAAREKLGLKADHDVKADKDRRSSYKKLVGDFVRKELKRRADAEKEADAQLVFNSEMDRVKGAHAERGAAWFKAAHEATLKGMGIDPASDIARNAARRGTYRTLLKAELEKRAKAEDEKKGAVPATEAKDAEKDKGPERRSKAEAEGAQQANEKDQKAQDEATADRDILAAGVAAGEATTVLSPAGRRASVQPRIVEMSDIVASHTVAGTTNKAYPQKFQPRDRSRAASQAQITDLSTKIQPERLMPQAVSSEGAPIVGPDGVVESGNGRVIALTRAYDKGMDTAKAYRDHLTKQGHDVSGFDRPILVQVRTEKMSEQDRLEFVEESNQRTTAERSATEQAKADAKKVNAAVLSKFAGGQTTHAANRDFVRAFMDVAVPEAERGGMVTGDGRLSQAGAARIENALFAKAYEAPDLLQRLREDQDNNIKTIGHVLIELAPAWAQMREAAANEVVDPKVDATGNLVEAVRLIVRARDDGKPLSEYVSQKDIFSGDTIPPLTEGFLAVTMKDIAEWKSPASGPSLLESLGFYIREAMKTAPGGDMFGGSASPEEILAKAREGLERRMKDEQGNQSKLDLKPGSGNTRKDPDKTGKGRTGRREQGSKDGSREKGKVSGKKATGRTDDRKTDEGLKEDAPERTRSGAIYRHEKASALRALKGAKDPHKAARDWLMRMEKEDGNEHLVILDNQGGLISAGTLGRKDNVDVPSKLLDDLLQGEPRYVAHHNHPSGRALSIGDVVYLFQSPAVDSVVAHSADGQISSARRTELSDRIINASPDGLAKLTGLMHLVGADVYSALRSRYKNAEITAVEANFAHGHAIMSIMHRIGLIEYRTSELGDLRSKTFDEPIIKDIDGLYASVKKGLKREFGYVVNETGSDTESGPWVDDRPAIQIPRTGEGKGADRGMGGLLGVSESDPAQEQVAQGGNPQRPKDTDGLKTGFQEGPAPFTEGVEFSNPKAQADWETAKKGLAGQRKPLLARVKDTFAHFGQLWVRSHRHLPRTTAFADAQAYLRKVTAAPSVATEEVVRYLHDLTKDLNQTDLELMTFKMLADDLQHDVGRKIEIPFFEDYEEFFAEKGRIDATMKARPDLMARVHKRRRYVNKLKDRMVKAGTLTKEQASNPMYFRHQVLEYAALNDRGLAGGRSRRLRKPRIISRRGTTMVINAKLVEVEAEWMFRALTGTINMEQIAAIQERYDVSDDLDQEIRQHNQGEINKLLGAEFADAAPAGAPEASTYTDIRSYLDSLKEDEPKLRAAVLESLPLYNQMTAFRRDIAMGMESIKSDPDINPKDWPKHIRERWEGMIEVDEDGGPVGAIDFSVVSWIAQNVDSKAAAGAASILRAVSARRQFVRETLGKDYAVPGNYEAAIKRFGAEGLAVWQPDPGSIFFLAKTVPDTVVEHFQARLAENLGEMNEFWTQQEMQWALDTIIQQSQAKSSLVQGAKKPQFVLPQELADTLNDMGGAVEEGPLMNLAMNLTRLHKQWLLISPRTWFRYNLQNITGDLDGAIAAFPKSLNVKKYMGPAVKELWEVQVKRGKPSATYLEAAERGVFDAGWSLNEAYEAEGNLADVMGKLDRKLPEQALRKVWRFFSRSTTYRENWLRYAMYMAVKDQIDAKQKENPGAPVADIMPLVGYGAARRRIVDATSDPADRAALIARESIGDYGDISVAGDYLRKRFLWFWSWQEINFKRYMRISANIYHTQTGFGRNKELAKLGARAGTRAALWLTIRASMFFGLVSLWNHLMFPEEEEELGREDKLRLHIILGRGSDGKIIQLRAPGALSDFFGWFGYEDIMAYFREVEAGRGDWKELVKSVALAPVNRVALGLTPVIKAPMEQATGLTFFPKFYEPRNIRDPWRQAFRTFRVEHEFDAILGRPSRGYAESWKEAIVTRRDPQENAYQYIRSMAYEWKDREKGKGSFSPPNNERNRATYYFRKAVRYDDKAAREFWQRRMRELGVTGESYRRIIKGLHPLGPLALKDRRRFMATLTTEERRRYSAALEHYRTMVVTGR